MRPTKYGNDCAREKDRIEEAAYRLSDDVKIKAPALPSAGLTTPLEDLLRHKVATVNSARLRAGVGALFSMAGVSVQ